MILAALLLSTLVWALDNVFLSEFFFWSRWASV